MARESEDRKLLRAFLADLMGSILLGDVEWTGTLWRYDDKTQAETSKSDLQLIKRARALLKLKPLVLRMPDKPDWYHRAGQVAEAWANGKTITRKGEIRQ